MKEKLDITSKVICKYASSMKSCLMPSMACKSPTYQPTSPDPALRGRRARQVSLRKNNIRGTFHVPLICYLCAGEDLVRSRYFYTRIRSLKICAHDPASSRLKRDCGLQVLSSRKNNIRGTFHVPLICYLCAGEDLHLHAFRHYHLKVACILFHHPRIIIYVRSIKYLKW